MVSCIVLWQLHKHIYNYQYINNYLDQSCCWNCLRASSVRAVTFGHNTANQQGALCACYSSFSDGLQPNSNGLQWSQGFQTDSPVPSVQAECSSTPVHFWADNRPLFLDLLGFFTVKQLVQINGLVSTICIKQTASARGWATEWWSKKTWNNKLAQLDNALAIGTTHSIHVVWQMLWNYRSAPSSSGLTNHPLLVSHKTSFDFDGTSLLCAIIHTNSLSIL